MYATEILLESAPMTSQGETKLSHHKQNVFVQQEGDQVCETEVNITFQRWF